MAQGCTGGLMRMDGSVGPRRHVQHAAEINASKLADRQLGPIKPHPSRHRRPDRRQRQSCSRPMRGGARHWPLHRPGPSDRADHRDEVAPNPIRAFLRRGLRVDDGGIDRPRTQRIHADATMLELGRPWSHEATDGCLGRAIGTVRRKAHLRGEILTEALAVEFWIDLVQGVALTTSEQCS